MSTVYLVCTRLIVIDACALQKRPVLLRPNDLGGRWMSISLCSLAWYASSSLLLASISSAASSVSLRMFCVCMCMCVSVRVQRTNRVSASHVQLSLSKFFSAFLAYCVRARPRSDEILVHCAYDYTSPTSMQYTNTRVPVRKKNQARK